MNPVDDLSQRSPEEIQSRIAHTRKSLDRKLDELGERLDPAHRLAEVKEEVSQKLAGVKEEVSGKVDRFREDVSARAPQILAWSAVGAVAAGAMMAATGWRRVHHNHDAYVRRSLAISLPDEEPLGDGIVSGPTTVSRRRL